MSRVGNTLLEVSMRFVEPDTRAGHGPDQERPEKGWTHEPADRHALS
jgi:hypothetical protein